MKYEFKHQPVLLAAVINNLLVDPDGFYIDGTYGRGGHSDAILQHLSEAGRLFAFDRDPTAVSCAQQQHGNDKRFTIIHESFDQLQTIVEQQQLTGKIDGVFLDLGVSSPQIDDAQRGFSFMQDGPLDMRMDNSQGITVAQWLTQTDERELANVLYKYGEEKCSRRIARAILQQQAQQPISTTKRLADIISAALPKKEYKKHPATRSFQALRIFINQELQQLHLVLEQAYQVLKVGGRLAVISFHSLEDRIVKQFLQNKPLPKGLPLTDVQIKALQSGFKVLSKPIKADEQELQHNVRSRSATLRVAEKIA
jgi:16S rRNA (cytosine1402-N4)-methyltransferase